MSFDECRVCNEIRIDFPINGVYTKSATQPADLDMAGYLMIINESRQARSVKERASW